MIIEPLCVPIYMVTLQRKKQINSLPQIFIPCELNVLYILTKSYSLERESVLYRRKRTKNFRWATLLSHL